MKNLITIPFKIISFIFDSLKPIGLIISILLILGAALFIYDQYHTLQERKTGVKLIENLKVEESCRKIVNAGEKFNLKFTFINGNSRSIGFEQLQINKGLLVIEGKKFLELASSSPSFVSKDTADPQYSNYYFGDVNVKRTSKLPFALAFQATSKEEAKAATHSIVVYKGSMLFVFEYEITIEVPCEIQVRYAN